MICADCGREFVAQHRYCNDDLVLNTVRTVPALRVRVRAILADLEPIVGPVNTRLASLRETVLNGRPHFHDVLALLDLAEELQATLTRQQQFLE